MGRKKLEVNTGDRYGRLTIIKEVEQHIQPSGQSVRMFKCLCDCGNETINKLTKLKTGNTKSCGCLNKELTIQRSFIHNHSINNNSTKTYNSWAAMKQRCLNPNHKFYKFYGNEGITVCERWMKFKNFLEDMGERPEGKTLDRFPNQRGNYEPGNCRWATIKEQNNNRRKRGHKTN